MNEESVKIADITEAHLIEDGWTKTVHPVYPFQKSVPNRNPLNNSEDSEIRLVIHGMYNAWRFAIALPDGGLLNFVVNSMRELKDFESRIDFYDPPF
jgi:hypothetical protein